MPSFSNVDSINNYYKSLQEPINANMRQAENDYNANLEKLRQTKEGQDAQAYRALQRQLKTVPEEMSAAGGQGGMVDSGIAYIKNRYLQGRNDRDTQLAADNAALGRDYQNTLEGYRGQLAQYEQQAAADRAELEYQQALAAARAASGGGGGGSGRRYYSRGSGSDSTSNISAPTNDVTEGQAFNANYGNYRSLPDTGTKMFENTNAALNNRPSPWSSVVPSISGLRNNTAVKSATSATANKKANSNLASLNKYM